MFTGLIEATGEIVAVKQAPGGISLRLETRLASDLGNGDSVAIDGVCLTVTSVEAGGVFADVSPETARVTTLGTMRPGAIVNLERPLSVDARLGGHFVQGHVDAMGRVEQVREEGDSFRLTIHFPSTLAAYIVHKGSIAVSGVSLTVASLDEQHPRSSFDVQIIPYTWTHTNLRTLSRGDAVNLECDILGKYVARALERASWRAGEAGNR